MRLRSVAFLGFFGGLAVLPLACGGGGGPRPGAAETDIEGGGGGGEGGTVRPGDSGARDGDAAPQGEPANIEWTSTICGAVSCGIMGIRKSGFQELADVSFTVKDSEGVPVSGVAVVFELESPPSGTEFLNGGTGTQTVSINTDAKGIASARVQSGITLGVFTVKATVGPTLLARSPAIGVRGVTPANRGFSLQCGLRNMAVFADPLPPKALKTNCTATLVDRFNNPVGKPTTINFKVEAGAIASSVQSKAFDPVGANADEGKATVEFNSVGTFPPNNVAPLSSPGDYSTGVESSDGNTAPSGVNQRDGLVTILAYAAGEEAFDDNNSNGQWDAGENFIDQGEPFVDSNDNNQWDPGEFYADVAPSNGQYDPPNGIWDKATTVWTTTFILYSGWLTRVFIEPDPISVPVGATRTVRAYFSDDRWNRSQNGATTFQFSRTGVRGTAVPQFDAFLDGYGFGLTRALYDATNPNEICSATLARCVWLTKFQFTAAPAYFLGTTLTLTGAVADGTPQASELTFRGTVNAVYVEGKSDATFE
jgi:hypothetical protein